MKEGQALLIGYMLQAVGKKHIIVSYEDMESIINCEGTIITENAIPKWHKEVIDEIASGYKALQNLDIGDLLLGTSGDFEGKAFLFLGEKKATDTFNTVYFNVWSLDEQNVEWVYLHELPMFKLIKKSGSWA
jgi:hypothetical protein